MEALFTRTEHGGYKVTPLVSGTSAKGLEVWWPEGPRKYPSNRQALIAIINRTPDLSPGLKDPKTTFDRYFRRGKYQRGYYPEWDTLKIFRPEPSLATLPKSPPFLLKGSEELAIAPTLGIDLQKRGHEVRKLFYAGFARKVAFRGYDPEEVLQELYKAILIRNRGKCPWDPKKSSFGHYVHMVANCIISNYMRKYGRIDKNEVFGVSDVDGELVDVSASNLCVSEADQGDLLEYLKTKDQIFQLILMEAPNKGIPLEVVKDVFELVSGGARNKDLKKELPHAPQKIAEAMRLVQGIARLWAST